MGLAEAWSVLLTTLRSAIVTPSDTHRGHSQSPLGFWKMVLSQGRVSLEQRLGTALQIANFLILSLFLCCFSNPTYLTHWRILYHTHSSRLPRLSSPGLGSLLNHLAEHCVVYWANWIPQYQNQKMLSWINWLRQLIARDKAKQPQLKNQLTKSHESSQQLGVTSETSKGKFVGCKLRFACCLVLLKYVILV